MKDDRKSTESVGIRINVNVPYDLRHWMKELQVSEEQLRTAVERVGLESQVRAFLDKP